jgi:hypothetical protein
MNELRIYLFIYLLCFANFTQSAQIQTQEYKLSIMTWYILQLTPITAALTKRT